MADEPEIVVNEFGDLSRRARRELIERGVDPESAKDEYIKTGSITLPTSIEVQQNAESSLPPFQEPPAPAVESDPLATGALSKRDVQNILERASAVETSMVSDVKLAESVYQPPPIPSSPSQLSRPVAQSAPSVPGPSTTAADVPAPTIESIFESQPAIAPQEGFDVIEAPAIAIEPEEFSEPEVVSEPEAVSEPVTIAEATAAENAATGGMTLDQSTFSPSTATGSIPTTSHALILPTLPDTTGPIAALSQTGEIVVTGSITLPSSIAQVGADVDHLDTSDVDVIQGDVGITVSNDLAPISAAVAVNAYGTKTSMVSAPRGMSDRLPVVLSIAAAGLAIIVVGLFVAGYFLKLF